MSNTQESSKFERTLAGKRVQIRSLDWQRSLTGVLVKIERYCYILKLDAGGTICLLKHGCSAIAAIKGEEEES